MNDKVRLPNLMDEYPLLVYPSLAKAMGINKAVVFQQLHFLLNNQRTAKNEYVFVDGRWWVYNTYEEWRDTYFYWLASVTLKGIFRELEADKLILTMQSVKNKSDRRKWYTIDYQKWESYQNTIGQKISDQPMDKKYPLMGSKISDGYSETSSETIKDTPRKRSEHPREPFYDAIAQIFNLTASGQIVCVRGMMQGTAKRGTWKDCNFTPPVTDPQEIIDFGAYMERRKAEKHITEPITAAVTIQRWFYDFREQKAKVSQPTLWADIPELAGITEIIR